MPIKPYLSLNICESRDPHNAEKKMRSRNITVRTGILVTDDSETWNHSQKLSIRMTHKIWRTVGFGIAKIDEFQSSLMIRTTDPNPQKSTEVSNHQLLSWNNKTSPQIAIENLSSQKHPPPSTHYELFPCPPLSKAASNGFYLCLYLHVVALNLHPPRIFSAGQSIMRFWWR